MKYCLIPIILSTLIILSLSIKLRIKANDAIDVPTNLSDIKPTTDLINTAPATPVITDPREKQIEKIIDRLKVYGSPLETKFGVNGVSLNKDKVLVNLRESLVKVNGKELGEMYNAIVNLGMNEFTKEAGEAFTITVAADTLVFEVKTKIASATPVAAQAVQSAGQTGSSAVPPTTTSTVPSAVPAQGTTPVPAQGTTVPQSSIPVPTQGTIPVQSATTVPAQGAAVAQVNTTAPVQGAPTAPTTPVQSAMTVPVKPVTTTSTAPITNVPTTTPIVPVSTQV
jgi:hypothetical protein